MNKDLKYIILFVVIGLGLAFALSGPLRDSKAKNMGTNLQEEIYVRGVIHLGPELTAQIDRYPFLFILAHAVGQQVGLPIAVRRYVRPTYPFDFKLAKSDNMAGEDFFAGDLAITVRLDSDGLAMPKQATDIEKILEVKPAESRQVEVIFP